MTTLLIRGGTVVNADRATKADVLCIDGLIAAVGPNLQVPAGEREGDETNLDVPNDVVERSVDGPQAEGQKRARDLERPGAKRRRTGGLRGVRFGDLDLRQHEVEVGPDERHRLGVGSGDTPGEEGPCGQ